MRTIPLVRPSLAVALALVVAAASLALGPRAVAHAHPLGNFTINRYARIEVYGDALRVVYVLDYAEIPAFQLRETIDADGDGEISGAELDHHRESASAEHAAAMELAVDGRPLVLTLVESESTVSPGQGGLDVLRETFVYQAADPGRAVTAVTYADHNFEGRAGWREIVVRPAAGTDVRVAPALLLDHSDGLRSYPTDSLSSAPEMATASFEWAPGPGAVAPATADFAPVTAPRSNSGFADLLERHQSFGVIILGLLAAFGFGALHALGPGHGKTVVAAYLVGSRGTTRHALALGMTVTATHTATVYLLGLVTLTLSEFIVPERLYLYLGVASGAMVVVMGVALFAGRVLHWKRAANGEGTHRHGSFARPHYHSSEAHHHGTPDHHAHDAPGVSWRGLLTLGVAGGLLPCPSAIVVMLAAISIGQIAFGMLLIVAFSLGLAGVLSAIGIALVLGKRLSGRSAVASRLRRTGVTRAVAALPLLSAAGVTLAGALITFQAWNQPGL